MFKLLVQFKCELIMTLTYAKPSIDTIIMCLSYWGVAEYKSWHQAHCHCEQIFKLISTKPVGFGPKPMSLYLSY